MPEPTPPPAEDWIDRYLNGELDASEHRAFERWLLDDDTRIERLARAVLQDTQLRAAVVSRRLESGFSMLDAASDHSDEHLRAIDRAIMDELVDQALSARRKHEVEDAANALLLADQARAKRERQFERADSAGADTTQRVIIIPKLAVWASVAAVLLVAATVVFQLNKPAPTAPRTVEQPATPDRQAYRPVMATLVRTLDARWADDAGAWDGPRGLRQGAHTLAEGLVEVELTDGARVVFEAPVSFELTGHNALSLTSGRLVANVPPSAYGFTVDTPTARIIDYGTEFGVHADGQRSTGVQVYDGEVRAAPRLGGAVVGSAVPLVEQQAASIDAGAQAVERIAFDATAFERRVVKRLDLVDIVAGGDGTGTARMRGINTTTGQTTDRPILGFEAAHLPSPGRYLPVSAHGLIDGVFTPDRRDGVVVSSTGLAVDGLAVSDARSYGLLWAGGLMPSFETEDELRDAIALRYGPGADAAPVLYMISNKGVTFDLDAVRAAAGASGDIRFRAEVESVNHLLPDPTGFTADIHCYLDGERVASLEGVTPDDAASVWDLVAGADARFLTLVVVDGGDGLGHDWVVLHRPVLEVTVPETGAARTP